MFKNDIFIYFFGNYIKFYRTALIAARAKKKKDISNY